MYGEFKFVIFLILALAFFIIYVITNKGSSKKSETYDGMGTITRINMNDRGDTWYYVDINVNGTIHSAQTDSYVEMPNDTKIGDQVNVVYRYTKSGDIRCYINQEGFKRIIQDKYNTQKPVILYIAIFLFAIFAIMLIKYIFKI